MQQSLDESTTRSQLLSLLKLANCGKPSSVRAFTEICTALSLADYLEISLHSSTSLRHMILDSIAGDDLADPLRLFLEDDQGDLEDGAEHAALEACPYVYAYMKNQLRQKICSLILKPALLSKPDELRINPSIVGAFVDKSLHLPHKVSRCKAYKGLKNFPITTGVPLLEVQCTPDSAAASKDWRSRISDDMVRNAKNQHQTILRTMEEVCRDLERRCEAVEYPLREELNKSTRLASELDVSQLLVTKLEAQIQETSLVLEGMDQEKTLLSNQVRNLEDLLQTSSESFSEMRESLNAATKHSESITRSAEERISERHLMYTAILAEKEEIIEEKYRQVSVLEAQAKGLNVEIQRLRIDKTKLEDEAERLNRLATEQSAALREAEMLGEAQKRGMNDLKLLNDSTIAEKGDLDLKVRYEVSQ